MKFGRSLGVWSRTRQAVAIGLAGLLVGGAAAAFSSVSSASAPPSTQQQEKGMHAGLPLAEPTNLNLQTPPVLRLRLVAHRTLFDISGKKVWGKSYNGKFVGPTLHFLPGERVELTLVNQLSTPTNLHFHGLRLSPSGSGDNPFISVPAGHSFTYYFTVPNDQTPGTFWYHDHDMCMGNSPMNMPGMSMPAHMRMSTTSSKCLDVESQLYDGLAGTIIVGDVRNLLPAALHNITTHTLVFKDMQITADNHIRENGANTMIDDGAPTVRLVNGQLRPLLNMKPGSTELWHLANEGADIFYNLSMPNWSFTVVGEDGQLVRRTVKATSLLLPAGKRYDVVVTAPKAPGDAWLHTLAYNSGPVGNAFPDVELLHVRVAGTPANMSTLPANVAIGSEKSLANAPIAQHRDVHLGEDESGQHMTINGKPFDMNKSIFSTPAVLGTTEEWTIYNDTGEAHPFHVHTDYFQVMSINGKAQPFNGDQDTVVVPFIQKVVIRIHFEGFTGKVMFHCHIAAHEVAGMMSFINVVAPKH